MTLHGRLDFPEVARLLETSNAAVVSISYAQRHPIPRANWLGTVPHGVPAHRLRPQLKPGQYLAFLGRMCPEKRPDAAIRAAQTLGLPIRLAAKVDREDQVYFDQVVRPLLAGPDVAFVGEIGVSEVGSFLGNASALLFPIDWPEPFGLVMIEAMACGTPVISMHRGSVPEVIRDGASGYIVNSELEFLAAIDRIGNISRAAVRQDFETRFTSQRMAQDYVRIYERLLEPLTPGPSQFQRTGTGIESAPSADACRYSNGAGPPDARRSDPLVPSIVLGGD
jgi:glycosyltransferase involved in cell wall biosynthesis